jgi:hypothetical protein
MWTPPPTEYFEALTALMALLFLATVFETSWLKDAKRRQTVDIRVADYIVLHFLTITIMVAIFSSLLSIVSASVGSTVVATIASGFATAFFLMILLGPHAAELVDHISEQSRLILIPSLAVALSPIVLSIVGAFLLA